MNFDTGARLGPYEILGPLGAGGMGEVYRARDTRLDREVALKLLPRRLTTDPEAIARFRREAFTLASLSHPNIATVHGFEETPDGPMVLVLEKVEGETLTERLGRSAMPSDEALQVCAQIAQALEVAHERGVIHRDVKPGNVMIGPRGLVKVLDFGLARRAAGTRESAPPEPGRSDVPQPAPVASEAPDEAQTIEVPRMTGTSSTQDLSGSGTTVGTPGYMSPEQVLAAEVDERTDVFAFGCVLYECLAGRRAFMGRTAPESMTAVLEQPPDWSALPPATPARVRALLAKCLEKEAADRLATMRSARIELEETLGIRRASTLREGDRYSTPHNLPAPTTSFVGRVAIVDECRRLLAASRLLTLAAMGGSGKTRLAVRLAESLLGDHPDGVWFVDLAPLADSGRVVEVAAEALAVADEPGRTPLESLTGHIRDRRMLFVLDNCEEVLEGAATLAAALLRSCPATRVIATSRQALGLEGETVFMVPALAIPAAAEAASPESLRGFEAVELFVDRARAARPEFELTGANAPAVAEICRRLDGIPIALELAAARIRMLDVEEIRTRLHDRFKLLARPGGDPQSRRHTVKAVIQWSWDHLLAPERDLMRRLAVFTGGWTLERAARVCSESEDEFELLDLLTRLVERSLVVVDRPPAGLVRYRFLESVWRFALEQLEAHEEQTTLRDRHLAVYLDLAERAEKVMTGAGMGQQIAELLPEEENLLAALAFSAHAADGAKRGLRLAAAVQRYWSAQGRYALGRRAIEEVLDRDGADQPSRERAFALTRVSGLCLVQGDHEAARRRLEESLAYWRTAADRPGLPATLAGLGVVAMYQSRFEDALALGEESLAIYRERGARRGIGMALHNLGSIEFALDRGDFGRAHFESALVLLRESGDRSTEALNLGGLSSALVHLGELTAARARLRECFAILERIDTPRERTFALEALAELAEAVGRPADAMRFIGAAAALRVTHSMPPIPSEARNLDLVIRRVAQHLGTEEAERCRAAGQKAPVDRVLADAAALLDEDDSGGGKGGLLPA
jgi:predicted ATPase/serine/threonine protein kinase